jgi:hypothetical protein
MSNIQEKLSTNFCAIKTKSTPPPQDMGVFFRLKENIAKEKKQ